MAEEKYIFGTKTIFGTNTITNINTIKMQKKVQVQINVLRDMVHDGGEVQIWFKDNVSFKYNYKYRYKYKYSLYPNS